MIPLFSVLQRFTMAFVVRFYSIEAFEMKHVISPLHHFFFEEMQCLVGKLHGLCGGDGSCQENRGLLQFLFFSLFV